MEKKSQQLFNEMVELIEKAPKMDCAECPLTHCSCVTTSCRAMSVLKALSDTIANIGEDTNLPRSAKRSVGEDINAPTTPPSWIKRGQWVMDKDGQIWKIVGFAYGLLQVVVPNKEAAHIGPWQELKPVKFRKYTYEEAEGLLGKAIKKTEMISGYPEHYVALINRVEYKEQNGGLYINLFDFNWWASHNATIDGIPIGVPEVDVEAMKEVE